MTEGVADVRDFFLVLLLYDIVLLYVPDVMCVSGQTANVKLKKKTQLFQVK